MRPGSPATPVTCGSTAASAGRVLAVDVDDRAIGGHAIDVDMPAHRRPRRRRRRRGGDRPRHPARRHQLRLGLASRPAQARPAGRARSRSRPLTASTSRRRRVLGRRPDARDGRSRCARLLGQDLGGEAGELDGPVRPLAARPRRLVHVQVRRLFTPWSPTPAGSAAAHGRPAVRDAAVPTTCPPTGAGAVPLLKRAQITVHDLATTFAGQGPGWFVDVDRLTMFADNLVPHVLRVDGVLVLEPSRSRSASAAASCSSYGSPEEVELRACAVARGRTAGRAHRDRAPAAGHALWRRGGAARYKAVPRPRCRTTAY